MRKYSLSVNLIIAIVAVVIIGSTLDVIDQSFGTHLSATTGVWLAAVAAVLLVAYVFVAFKSRKK